MNKPHVKLGFFIITSVILNACSNTNAPNSDAPVPLSREEERKRSFGKLFGDDFMVFGPGKKTGTADMPIGSVNRFIWRASLDTLSFMPLGSADAVGGVIVTDWYQLPNNKRERIKVSVYIIKPELRADSLKVTINKQALKDGQWITVSVDAEAARDMEDVILSKAREIRIAEKTSRK